MLLAAAIVPCAPLLVPAVAGGSAQVDAALREHTRTAVRSLIDAAPDEVVVVGVAPVSGPLAGSWDWSGFGVPLRGGTAPGLPLALGIGDWLLGDAGWTGVRAHCGVADATDPEGCAALGAALVAGPRRTALLVCGDGTACRTEKAPGFLDPRAAGYDAEAAAALSGADPDALLRLDAALGRELLVAGRAPWQVLAGAAESGRFVAEMLYGEAPYGVAYFVVTWGRVRG